jgi:hypothetical protein
MDTKIMCEMSKVERFITEIYSFEIVVGKETNQFMDCQFQEE